MSAFVPICFFPLLLPPPSASPDVPAVRGRPLSPHRFPNWTVSRELASVVISCRTPKSGTHEVRSLHNSTRICTARPEYPPQAEADSISSTCRTMIVGFFTLVHTDVSKPICLLGIILNGLPDLVGLLSLLATLAELLSVLWLWLYVQY